MEHIFICYSHEDEKIAREFLGILRKAGKAFWIDVENLHASSIWRTEIQDAITSSIAFVYLVSANSLESEYCKGEFEIAVDLNKRIFPILLPGITDKDVPEIISSRQWLIWSRVGQSQLDINKLITDIETDHEWVKFITELGVSEARWKKQPDNSRLLSGKKLQEAEQLVNTGGKKNPQPTELQREYVKASRKAEQSRKKTIAGVATIASIVLCLLCIIAITGGTVAYFQSNARATAQIQANEQGAIAQAEQLAALALSQIDNKLDLGLLLSVEAFRKKDTLQTQRALYLARQNNPKLKQYLQGHTYPIVDVAWSSNGQLATASNDYDGLGKHIIIIWDLESGKPAQTLYPNSQTISLAWSNNGLLASSSSNDTAITIWDLENGKPAQVLKVSRLTGLAWSYDGRLTFATDNGIYIWDLQSSKPEQILAASSVGNISWSSDGQLAYVVHGDFENSIGIWDPESGKSAQILSNTSLDLENGDIVSTGSVGSIAWSNDGRLATTSENIIIIWDLETGEPAQILQSASLVEGIAWSYEGVLASISNEYIGISQYTIEIWDLENGKPAQTLEGHTDGITCIAWSSGGLLASGSADKTVIVWDLQSTQPDQIIREADFVNSVAWSSGGLLASGAQDNKVIIWDLQNNEPSQVLTGHTGSVNSIAWSSDGRLASGGGPFDHTVIIWDLQSGRPAQIFKGHTEGVGVNSVAWSDDGKLASVEDDGSIIVWNFQSSLPAQKIDSSSTSIAWSHDGRLASATDGGINIWDLNSTEPAQVLQGHTNSVTSIAWSSEDRLASGSVDDTVIVWDLQSGKPAQILYGHTDDVTGVAWSNDGRLASGARDGIVIIWDLQSGKPAQVLDGHTNEVTSIAWSSDARLASGSHDKTIIIWEGNPEVWEQQSCQRAGRNLTQEEWNFYFPEEQYHQTCLQWSAGE